MGTSLKDQDVFDGIQSRHLNSKNIDKIKNIDKNKNIDKIKNIENIDKNIKTRNIALDVANDDPTRERLYENLFAYCPSLDTFDTCLFWECLYHDVVPVIVSNEISRDFLENLKKTGLPFVVVDEIKEETFDRKLYDSVTDGREKIIERALRIDTYMKTNNSKVKVSNR